MVFSGTVHCTVPENTKLLQDCVIMFLFTMRTRFNMSVIHSFLLMGGRNLHIVHVSSTLNCQWEEGWYPPHFSSSESHNVWGEGGGDVFIHNLDKLSYVCYTLIPASGVGPPHCTCNFNSQQLVEGRVVSSTFHIQ